MPTGAGKSTCVAACVFALYEIKEPDGTRMIEGSPVMVLMEQIQAGKDLVELLVEGYGERTGRPEDSDTGIDANLIAHVHADGGEDPEDAERVPIVMILVTNRGSQPTMLTSGERPGVTPSSGTRSRCPLQLHT